jgi:hypothetical protein
MKRLITVSVLLGAVALVSCGATTISPPLRWTTLPTQDDGQDCLVANDVTLMPADSLGNERVEARRVGVTTWTTVYLGATAFGARTWSGPLGILPGTSPQVEFRVTVMNKRGEGCPSDVATRTLAGYPSKVPLQ